MHGLVALVCAVSLLAVGCSTGTTTIEGVQPTGEDESTTSLGPVADEVEPDDESSGLINLSPGDDDLVVCAGIQLPLRALQALEPMSSRPEVAAAVNSFLESGEGDFWPQESWQIVTISETEVYVIVVQTEAQVLQNVEDRELEVFFDDGFGDGTDDSIMFSAHDVELVDGTWRWAGSVSGEDCELETVVPAGLNRVEWELDPDSPVPTADSTSLNLWATERECAGGQPMGDRLLAPTVVETNDAILIAMAATRAPGEAFTCQGNPPQLITVDLSSPLGNRELLEGSTTAGRLSDHVGEAFGLLPLDE